MVDPKKGADAATQHWHAGAIASGLRAGTATSGLEGAVWGMALGDSTVTAVKNQLCLYCLSPHKNDIYIYGFMYNPIEISSYDKCP